METVRRETRDILTSSGTFLELVHSCFVWASEHHLVGCRGSGAAKCLHDYYYLVSFTKIVIFFISKCAQEFK